ncbi:MULTISPECIES: Na+/H+ antiporter NhaC family protein [Oceanobacillus]|uniref:Tetracycline efflux Na+/H+ antiporter family transporter Tet(35) n=1 Tax=Oceanobacillus kimchii TaxID=746691 RepID=A0ABQ5TMP8_9BACI|nr:MULTISPECIES: Na+/H+ antiporter NhaC family protein [Oceanobacillus]MBT2601183.1 Na+/H+ antiporter NhaC family protein [Oceanobacillus sp. ISL-74]MBT2652408.1 Na+/H+ antiporter NhaC family protein [Oceanobacillus sp. ISL-73]MCT1579072.1 Na+/H+ antiporter NhaC family protein [Oceanobacillus kimchii]MCT2137400.1 Na+/H+ antiporter NhaC family protein [Oceanobacillus kimchii]OEH54014.1 sodium:proton antiporter [Oceanobacillus sp. E9]
MEGTIYSLIPAVIMLLLVIITRNVLISLGTGIIVGALLIHNFNILSSITEIWEVFYTIFYAEDGWQVGNIFLLGFLLLLGILTAFLQASGGSRAFGDWMMKRVKTRTGAQVMTAVIGIIIFIDDYFNSLAVGQIARPLTDRHRISRAKLAYFIDSSSAPVTVLAPISSWGAYIIGTLGTLFAANEITEYQPFEAFIQMIPLNFYAISAIILVFIVAYFRLDLGPMHTHEKRAEKEGELLNPEQDSVAGDLGDVFDPHKDGKVYHLLVPIIVLFIVTIGSMYTTGVIAASSYGLVDAFANTDVNLSLILGGLSSVVVAAVFYFSQKVPRSELGKILIEGAKTMIPAINILLLAWMIGAIIGSIGTGDYLAGLVENASINVSLLPVILFIISAIMALSTGTSWGTFGIMLPIAANIMVNTDSSLLLPALAAVLAGAVFGDHCSPISDTTVLSSTGAGANHIDHVLTQLPYATIAAVSAIVGFTLVGYTHSTLLSLLVTIVLMSIIVLILKKVVVDRRKEKTTNE